MKQSSVQFTRATLYALVAMSIPLLTANQAAAQQNGRQPLVVNISSITQRVEMIVNTSRILTMEQKIPRAQVNNPDIVELTPLSPTQVQVFAKKPGITQINLWDQNERVQSIDIIVFGDAQELSAILKTTFPTAALRVMPVGNSVIISGFVDKPSEVSTVIDIAETYYPKVINNINVGGVQQVMLQVRVLEVSRTKLRQLGFDFDVIGSNGSFFTSAISGLLTPGAAPLGNDTLRFGIVGDTNFLGLIDALQQKNCVKVMAEPNLVTASGRPSSFLVGGEFPILVPQGLGGTTIEYKQYGTKVDFVPIVMGNGQLRLEMRVEVSELDRAAGVAVTDITVPGLRTRRADTGVTMSAGQTLALAGLVQNRVESEHKGVPFISDLPYLGVPFRRVEEKNNEIELLIMVTPELVDALDPQEVPPIGPGMHSNSPSNWDLYFRGHIEVPSKIMQQGQQFNRPVPFHPAPHLRQPVQPEPVPPGLSAPPDMPVPPDVPVPPRQSQRRPQSSIQRQSLSGSPYPPQRPLDPGAQPARQYDRLPEAPVVHQPDNRQIPQQTFVGTPKNEQSSGRGLIGAIGYDVKE